MAIFLHLNWSWETNCQSLRTREYCDCCHQWSPRKSSEVLGAVQAQSKRSVGLCWARNRKSNDSSLLTGLWGVGAWHFSSCSAHTVTSDCFFLQQSNHIWNTRTKLPVVMNAFTATLWDPVSVELKGACIQIISILHDLSKYELECLNFNSNVMKNCDQRNFLHQIRKNWETNSSLMQVHHKTNCLNTGIIQMSLFR